MHNDEKVAPSRNEALYFPSENMTNICTDFRTHLPANEENIIKKQEASWRNFFCMFLKSPQKWYFKNPLFCFYFVFCFVYFYFSWFFLIPPVVKTVNISNRQNFKTFLKTKSFISYLLNVWMSKAVGYQAIMEPNSVSHVTL